MRTSEKRRVLGLSCKSNTIFFLSDRLPWENCLKATERKLYLEGYAEGLLRKICLECCLEGLVRKGLCLKSCLEGLLTEGSRLWGFLRG